MKFSWLSKSTFFICFFAAAACNSQTGSLRFSFEAKVGGLSVLPIGLTRVDEQGIPDKDGAFLQFINENDWNVTLSKANLTLGPIYLNVATPLQSSKRPLFESILGIRQAFAAGESHLATGRIVGEILDRVTVDTLSPSLVPFSIQGHIVQEEIQSAEIWFYPDAAISPESPKISDATLVVEGIAKKKDLAIPFSGSLILNDIWLDDSSTLNRGASSILDLRQANGISTRFYPQPGGHLELRVDITKLFRGADFSVLLSNPKDADGRSLLVQSKTGPVFTDQVMKNLYQGLKSSVGTYHFTWVFHDFQTNKLLTESHKEE